MTFRTIQEYADTPTFFSSSWGTVVAQLLSPAPTLSDPAASGNPGAAGVVINLAGTGLFDSPDAMVPNGVDVTFSGAGISVNSTTFNSPTSVDVNIDIAAGAAIGTRDITLTNPDGQAATVVGGFTVEAPNAAPTITSDGGGATAAVNVAENQTAVTDVESTDDTDSEEAGLTYSKTGGADQALFTLDGTTGLLTFTAPPDFEAPGDAGGNNVYDVQVTVTDAGALTDVQDIAVTVTNVNEAPTITSNGGGATAAVNVAENQTAVTDVESTDDTDSEEAGLTYSKTGGADQALFTLDGTTGLLTFTAPPDFEAPGDAGGNNVYDVQVTVTDAGALTDVQDIAVTVTNVNEAPTITSNGGGATAAVSVAENQTAVTDVESTDDTDSEEAGLTYSKTGGADQALFTLDGTTGLLTFTAPPDFEAPGDAGGNNVYDVQVTVTDAGALTDVQDIAVTVTDLGGAGAAFTDPVLTPGVSVPRAIYITELRARVNALRLTLALPAFVFTDPTVTPGVTLVRDDHVIELRTALVDAYLANGLSAPVYTDPGLGAGTGIRALHITELRQFVIALE